MDPNAREARIKGLQSIQKKALNLASEGADAFEVRDFVTESKKHLAYELPDQEAFNKAMNATLKYKQSKNQ